MQSCGLQSRLWARHRCIGRRYSNDTRRMASGPLLGRAFHAYHHNSQALLPQRLQLLTPYRPDRSGSIRGGPVFILAPSMMGSRWPKDRSGVPCPSSLNVSQYRKEYRSSLLGRVIEGDCNGDWLRMADKHREPRWWRLLLAGACLASASPPGSSSDLRLLPCHFRQSHAAVA